MQVQEQELLFAEIPSEESSVVSGGRRRGHDRDDRNDFHFNLDAYLFILGAGTVFGNPGLTPDETYHAWESAIHL